MIWADRIGFVWLLIWLAGWAIDSSGDPNMPLKIAVWVGVPWFLMRAGDFIATGRLRAGKAQRLTSP